jgi:hypothetical protein
MTKSFKFINSAIGVLLGSALLFGLMFLSACDNDSDPEPEEYEISGTYTFKEAILQTALTIPGVGITLPVGTPITNQMKDGLLAEAPCDDPDNGAVELKPNFELFFACVGENNELKTGTWSINSDTTELNLNLSVSSGNLQLKISNLTIDENNDVIGGTISNCPITKNLIAGFLAAFPEQKDAILAGIADDYVTLINVDVKFEKVP